MTPTVASLPFIAVVDDDPGIRDMVSTALDLFACEAIVAGSRAELETQLAGREPDLLIMDYWLTGEHGLRALQLLRELFQSTMPCLIISGNDTDIFDEIAATPNCRILHKPFFVAQLIGAAGQFGIKLTLKPTA